MKSILSLLFISLIQFAFPAATSPTRCDISAVNALSEIDYGTSASDPRFNPAHVPSCDHRHNTLAETYHYFNYLWLNHSSLFCTARLKNSGWSESKIKDICTANEDFDLVLISNSKNQNILIAGETHIKDSTAAEMGKKLLTQFQFRGVEGFSGDIEMGTNSGITGLLLTSLVKTGIAQDSTIITARDQGLYFSFDGNKSTTFLNGKSKEGIDPNPFDYFNKHNLQKNHDPVNIALERSADVRKELEANCPMLSKCNSQKRFKYLIQRRDDDMADSIRKIQTAMPYDSDLLVLVGSRHVADLSRLIACRSQYPVEVKRLSRMDGTWQTYFIEQRCR